MYYTQVKRVKHNRSTVKVFTANPFNFRKKEIEKGRKTWR